MFHCFDRDTAAIQHLQRIQRANQEVVYEQNWKDEKRAQVKNKTFLNFAQCWKEFNTTSQKAEEHEKEFRENYMIIINSKRSFSKQEKQRRHC